MWSFRLSLINLKWLEEDNELKPLSCKVKNKIETTTHNEFNFYKPEK